MQTGGEMMMTMMLMKKKAGGLRGLRKFQGVSELCKASTRKPGGTYQDRTETLQLYHGHRFLCITHNFQARQTKISSFGKPCLNFAGLRFIELIKETVQSHYL